MKFQIVSDLHLESDKSVSFTDVITPVAPNLILAGDIGHLTDFNHLQDFLEKTLTVFKNVIYVLGNHEYSKDDTEKTMSELLQELRSFAQEHKNLHLLEKNAIIVDGVCIAGCTLWSKAEVRIPPFLVKITNMNQELYNNMHSSSVEWLKKARAYANREKLKLLIITHYPPILEFAERTDRFRSLYSTDLEYLTEGVHTWVYGHVHRNTDFVNNYGCRLVSNQKGRPRDNVQDFSKEKVIEV